MWWSIIIWNFGNLPASTPNEGMLEGTYLYSSRLDQRYYGMRSLYIHFFYPNQRYNDADLLYIHFFCPDKRYNGIGLRHLLFEQARKKYINIILMLLMMKDRSNQNELRLEALGSQGWRVEQIEGNGKEAWMIESGCCERREQIRSLDGPAQVRSSG